MQITEVESWQIAGNSPAAYEEYLVPGFFKPWAEKLVHLSSPSPGSTILDVACGTVIVARTAAKAGSDARVTGLVLNQQMLNKASEMAEKEGLKINWQQGDAAFPLRITGSATCSASRPCSFSRIPNRF